MFMYKYIYILSITKASGIKIGLGVEIIDEARSLERMGLRV